MISAQPDFCACSTTRHGPYTKIRCTLPSSLARDAALLEDVRRHVRRKLEDEQCVFKEVRVTTRSKPIAIKVVVPTGLMEEPRRLVARVGSCLGLLIDGLGLSPEAATTVWRNLAAYRARALDRLARQAPSLEGDLDPLLAIASELAEAGDTGAAIQLIGRLPWHEPMQALDHLQTTLQIPPWVAMRLLCTQNREHLLSLLPWQGTATGSPARVMLMRLQGSLVHADEAAAAAALLKLLQGGD
ncbi:hypothetical protein [uncultured Hydrogenophaga sp.]|uniref:hypothetical protein n=1 Tax=uncultured Hydrogenophaga sp. TaxID=199683 RepID=UPI00265E9AA8|nr:hypothetical protein [uncultured Hydrogenophaga sp.]